MSPAKRLSLWSGLIVVFIVALILVGTAANKQPVCSEGSATSRFTFLALILAAGMTGGVVANYMRLRSLPIASELFTDPQLAYRAQVQMLVGPLVSGVFAGVLYSLFAGDLLTGSLFPKFEGGGAPFGTAHSLAVSVGEIVADDRNLLRRFFKGMYPATNVDGVKVIFWSFLAGYSERFVPNILDKLAQADSTVGRSWRDPLLPVQLKAEEGSLAECRMWPQRRGLMASRKSRLRRGGGLVWYALVLRP